ncbi:type VI secretion system protein ImpK [Rubrivivax gelatinosus]|uniref:Type VI secretion system protein ImpK n=1 Tax=Rubrivivax gelatinosus TaxID=28068 RepID=A0ABS1DWA4_RUBGE|nr:type VI secretion system protein ImpK [Rubrivivax gelatinosus]MBK1714339.1 type VI secretion system protein ImpK [Rubrivivax gelatinosus]
MADTPAVPSLMPGLRPTPRGAGSTHEASSLLDLMVDGFYMLFLLKNRYVPTGADELRERIRDFLDGVERGAKKLGQAGVETPAEDIYLAKYAYCALVDEIVLSSQGAMRDAWARKPLQLELFGEQLAGENFFVRLEDLRRQGAARVQALEVFHMCLLMGFQGKYMLEQGSEKLGYLCDRLGDEIANLKGRRAPFAPHWQAPDSVMNRLRSEVPLWVVGALFALAGLAAFIGMRWSLERETKGDLAGYAQIVKLPPPTAHITITLP